MNFWKSAGVILGLGAVLALGLGAAALAGDHHSYPPPTTTTTTGHTPVTICHKPGTPAEMTLIVDDDSVELTGHLGHGDYIGACQDMPPDQCEDTPGYQESDEDCEPPVDYCDTLEGVQAEDEDCPPPPTDTTPTTPTETTPTTPEQPRVCPDGKPPTPGEGAYDPNDDCKRPPTPPVTTTVNPPKPTDPGTPPTTSVPDQTQTMPLPPIVNPKPKPKPNPKPHPEPKPKPKPPVPHPNPPPHHKKVLHACATLADGTKRAWWKGGNGLKPGCYPVIPGSG